MSQQSEATAPGGSTMFPQFSLGPHQHCPNPNVAHGNTSKTAETPQPTPARAPDSNLPPKQSPYPRHQENHDVPRHRFLSSAEWFTIAHGVGGVQDREHQTPIHPESWWWPPKGMPKGLYKDTVTQRFKFFLFYHAASGIRWILMIAQLLIGATLTAIGSISLQNGIPVTVLGAANTVIAGLLAFLQNSGLPDRYRYDKGEFEAVEDHIRELLDSRIIPADQAIDQALAECFDLYQEAKATVSSNLPANYTSRLGQQTGQRPGNIIPAGAPPTNSKAPVSQFDGGKDTPGGGKEVMKM